MEVLELHKTNTITSITCISTMQDMGDFTSLCVNLDTNIMDMFSPESPQLLFRQFLLMFIKIVNSRD